MMIQNITSPSFVVANTSLNEGDCHGLYFPEANAEAFVQQQR
jgi:hypothetical protein